MTKEKGMFDKEQIRNRIGYIDIARAIGIIFVIVGHIVSSDTEIKKVLYAFHMPLFFILSGMLLKTKTIYNVNTWKKLIFKKLRALMLPYIMWSLIYSSFSFRHLALILYGTRETLSMAESLTSLWFLPVMFLAVMIVEFILWVSIKIKKNKTFMVLIEILICFLIGFLIPHYNTYGNPWGIDISFVAAAFILLGMLIEQVISRSKKSTMLATVIVLSVLFFITSRFSNSSVGYVLMANAIYGNIIVFIVNAITGSCLVILISRLVATLNVGKKIFSWIGVRTLGIFVIHKPIVELLRKVVTNAGFNLDNFVLIACITFVTLVVSGMAVVVIENVLPELIGLKNK